MNNTPLLDSRINTINNDANPSVDTGTKPDPKDDKGADLETGKFNSQLKRELKRDREEVKPAHDNKEGRPSEERVGSLEPTVETDLDSNITQLLEPKFEEKRISVEVKLEELDSNAIELALPADIEDGDSEVMTAFEGLNTLQNNQVDLLDAEQVDLGQQSLSKDQQSDLQIQQIDGDEQSSRLLTKVDMLTQKEGEPIGSSEVSQQSKPTKQTAMVQNVLSTLRRLEVQSQALDEQIAVQATGSKEDVPLEGASRFNLATPTVGEKGAVDLKAQQALSFQIMTPINKPEWVGELQQRLTVMMNEKAGVANINVTPSELGPIQVKMTVQNDQSQVQFFTPNAASREILESQLSRLRGMFEEQGIQLMDAGVHDGGEQGGLFQDPDSDDQGTDYAHTGSDEIIDDPDSKIMASQTVSSKLLVDYYI